MKTVCVITTIHEPTPAVATLDRLLPGHVIVVADRKTPEGWAFGSTRFLSVDVQSRLPFSSCRHIRIDHYSRKNIGYLRAMLLGADVIYDTDDDNVPNEGWREREKTCAGDLVSARGWCNVYSFFQEGRIWPRGLALHSLNTPTPSTKAVISMECPIQQGLADGDPDVDAIWRLTTPAPKIEFVVGRSVALAENVWCPFNSQTTWWWSEVFPLLFLPTTAPFRMTDIWRSFVAQRCLWASGLGSVVFHSPSEVTQERNAHDLMRDFEDEVPGYLHNDEIVCTLECLTLGLDMSENLRSCYVALVKAGILPAEELTVVDAWLDDVRQIITKPSWTR